MLLQTHNVHQRRRKLTGECLEHRDGICSKPQLMVSISLRKAFRRRPAAELNASGRQWMWSGGLTNPGVAEEPTTGDTRKEHSVNDKRLVAQLEIVLRLIPDEGSNPLSSPLHIAMARLLRNDLKSLAALTVGV